MRKIRPDMMDSKVRKNTENGCYNALITSCIIEKQKIIQNRERVERLFNSYTRNVKNMRCLFNECKNLNKIDLGIITGEPKEFHYDERPKMMLISAYRGEMEREELEKEAQKACAEAERIGMEKPVCILYNALIKL